MSDYVICYGRSVPSIGDQLFGKDKTMSDEEKTKKAQGVYDAVLNAFPNLRKLMITSQRKAAQVGYTETILGRRRHHPDMQLPEFEFVPIKGYVNPDVDPLNPETLKNKDAIPKRITDALLEEFKGYKYFGQIAKRMKELYTNDHIKVINNRPKITEASRAIVNCVDTDTEILTTTGWRDYSQVRKGTKIYSYDVVNKKIVRDQVEDLFVYNYLQNEGKAYDCYFLKSDRFNTVCTKDHRWIAYDFMKDEDTFVTTRDLLDNPIRYPKIRISCTGCDAIDYIDNSNFEILRTVQKTIVWCVQTGQHTWIARRGGQIYITGNSIIQGSAADLTKLAILRLENNEEWKDIGGKLINAVHDELIAEAPIQYAQRAGEILSRCMSEAGNFLPFPINCDVTTTYRWYGVEYPCPYKMPDHFDSAHLDQLSEDEVKWIQYHLHDLEYELPVFKDENGEKPRGDAALGINGKVTHELEVAILEYEGTYQIDDSEFIDHLYQNCEFGRVDNKLKEMTT